MQELNLMLSNFVKKKEEIISFKCDLHGNLQKLWINFWQSSNWDQYSILQAAIAGFLCKRDFKIESLQDFMQMVSMDFDNESKINIIFFLVSIQLFAYRIIDNLLPF